MRNGIVSIALAALIALSWASLASAAAPGEGSTQITEDSTALSPVGSDPALFRLKSLTGDEVNLEDYLGKRAVMLVFWSLFCGPCQEELPMVDEVSKKYAEKGLDVLTVNLDGPRRARAVEKYMNDKEFTFGVLWEEIDGTSYVTADKYGVSGTPTLVLIDKKGKISYTHVGQAELSILEKVVGEALAD